LSDSQENSTHFMEVKDSLPSSQELTNPSPKPPESRLQPSYFFKIQLSAFFPYIPMSSK